MLRIGMFYHSLLSDWNHGNAHFLRGIATDLQARGHEVRIFEPFDSWSRENLVSEHGEAALRRFENVFPTLRSHCYRRNQLDLEQWLDGTSLLLVHEWNDPEVIAAVGEYRRRHPGVRLFFHDTHHRAVTARSELERFNLSNYDAVLAYGASLKNAYEELGWGKQVHVWHEAADTRVFYPRLATEKAGDVVWVGNWGDEERTAELREFFVGPVKELRLRASAYGVRYPQTAVRELSQAGIAYHGWLPNFEAPRVFAEHRVTIHVPRRPYVRQLPGIPTIRPFEALACGIPLVTAPWPDVEELFRPGIDFLVARNGNEMKSQLRAVLEDAALAGSLTAHGLETVLERHTCTHRVDELLRLFDEVRPAQSTEIAMEAEVAQ